MTNKTRKWFRSGIEVLIHGGAAAVTSTLITQQIDPKTFNWFTPNFWHLLGGSFLVNGALRFFQWWQNNPLPPEGDTTPPFPSQAQPQQISLNPLTKVQQVPTETV